MQEYLQRKENKGVPAIKEHPRRFARPILSLEASIPKSSCACGGGCPSCKSKEADLPISKSNDPAELEADRIADQVMSRSGSGAAMGPIANAGAGISRKSAATTPNVGGGEIGTRINSLRGSGVQLDRASRGFFEGRFGTDLGNVRIHSGHEAARLSKDISAKAFTTGNDIFFGEGQYQPDTDTGKKLLAHELTHVQQGGNELRRCEEDPNFEKFDEIVLKIFEMDEYKNLDADFTKVVHKIIDSVSQRPNCLYYVKKLHLLLQTPHVEPQHLLNTRRKKADDAVAAEKVRLETAGKESIEREERLTDENANERQWVEYPTQYGDGKYKVDARDPLKIFVMVKVNLTPVDEGTWDDVVKVKYLEDAIEKYASARGFVLNLEFVNPENDPKYKPEKETVGIGVNPKWPIATQWGSDARTCAHELFHVLNFPVDRYDYIEAHAGNKHLDPRNRLDLFKDQLEKAEGYDNPKSLMGPGGQSPISEDICMIAQLDLESCVKARILLEKPDYDFRFLMRPYHPLY